MAVKPIVTIDVDDAAFQRFTSLFNDYSAKLDEMPEAWQRLNEAMGGGADALKSGALGAKEALALAGAQAILIVEELKNATKGQSEFGRETERSHKGMKGLATSAKGLGSTIFGIGKWITGIGIAALGLGAIGSGFGFGALAGAALNRQRSANQLGLNPGQLASFQINAQQFLDVGALRSAVETQADITKSGALANLGIDFRRAQGMTPSDLAFEELIKARAAYLQDKRYRLSPMQDPRIQGYLAVGGQYGDVLNAAMPGNLARILAARADVRRDAGRYSFDPATAAQWITLKKAMDSAGVSIETVLINGLSKLATPLGTLSHEVVDFVKTMVNSDLFKEGIDKASEGLKWLGDYLNSPKAKTDFTAFETNFGAFTADLGMIGAEIGVIADKFKWLLPKGWGDNRTPAEKASDAKHQANIAARTAGAMGAVNNVAGAGKALVEGAKWYFGPASEAVKKALEGSGPGLAFQVMRKAVATLGWAGGSGAAGSDLANPAIAHNSLIALLYGLKQRGLVPGVGWVKTGHHDDGPLLHAGGYAADIDLINKQSVDSWAGKQAALALAGYAGTRTLGLDPWMRSQAGTMAKIRAKMAAHGGTIFNETSTHIHASSYPDETARKPHPALLKALRQRRSAKPTVHVTVQDNTAGRTSVVINGAHW
jgi:hypothetical protein